MDRDVLFIRLIVDLLFVALTSNSYLRHAGTPLRSILNHKVVNILCYLT